jgi:putative copper resistance protein D
VLTQILDVYSFLSVLLRGGALVFQSLIVGGSAFSFWVLRPLNTSCGAQGHNILESSRRLILWSAVAFAFLRTCYLASESVLLTGTTSLGWRDVIGANFFIAGAAGIGGALLVVAITARREWKPGVALLAPSIVILITLVATSHAAGRVAGRTVLAMLGTFHMLAVGFWVGALAYFVVSLARAPDLEVRQWLCRRFSRLAALSVAVVAASGCLLSRAYIDSPEALYGTAYGAMAGAKAALFAILLGLGGLNFLIVRRMSSAGDELITRLRRVAEVELGIGITIILTAASLSSQPPAVDLVADRVPLSVILERLSPRWPGFDTPPVSSLSPPTPLGSDPSANGPTSLQSFVPGTSYSPNTPDDIAWSEYNHHWAGLIVLAAGLLAVAARFPALRAARHWPLAFLGLAVFLFFRADPENWPLGPRSFWQSFMVAEVLQHRLFILLIVVFAIYETGVATGRISSPRAALVFPAVCAAGGALLLTHAHPLGNIREELLSELSHLLLGILAVVAGWSRWLEIRASGYPRQIASSVWPGCFLLIGAILMNYRES